MHAAVLQAGDGQSPPLVSGAGHLSLEPIKKVAPVPQFVVLLGGGTQRAECPTQCPANVALVGVRQHVGLLLIDTPSVEVLTLRPVVRIEHATELDRGVDQRVSRMSARPMSREEWMLGRPSQRVTSAATVHSDKNFVR